MNCDRGCRGLGVEDKSGQWTSYVLKAEEELFGEKGTHKKGDRDWGEN